jgi:CheY-like chemotaxis protein
MKDILQASILIVDEEPINVELLERILQGRAIHQSPTQPTPQQCVSCTDKTNMT